MEMSKQRQNDKEKNLESIFWAVQRHGPIERRQIQAKTNLSWGTVSQYTGMLLQAGVFQQNLTPARKVGKTPLILDINNRDCFIIGVDFNFRFVRAIVMDMKGNLVKSALAPIADASKVVELLLESLRELVGQFSGANFLAISIAVQGGIDEERGIALYLSFEPTWRNLRLKEIVESQFGIRTFIFHDPDCVLVAEKYFGSALREQYANVVTINANLGIGMSLMLRSKLYSSTFGHTGELGHTTAEPDGALCSCGKRGCLEAYASRTGIVNRFIDAVSEGRKTVIDKDAAFAINYDLVRDGALQGDPLCAGLFRQAGLYLGRSLASVATILEPDAIILYGELANDRRLYGDVLEQTFQKHVYALCQTAICYSDLPGTAPVLGAAMYALEKVLRGFLLSKA